jgi:hypothetical protein
MFKFFVSCVQFIALGLMMFLGVGCQTSSPTLFPKVHLASDQTLNEAGKVIVDGAVKDAPKGAVVTVGIGNKFGATPADVEHLRIATHNYFGSLPQAQNLKLETPFRQDFGTAMGGVMADVQYAFKPVWEMTPEEVRANRPPLKVYGIESRQWTSEWRSVGAGVRNREARSHAQAGVFAGYRERLTIYRTSEGRLRVYERVYDNGVVVDANTNLRTDYDRRISRRDRERWGENDEDRRLRDDFNNRARERRD